MPSPVAHSLAGATLWAAFDKERKPLHLTVAVVVANLADADFLPGLVQGNANLYHHAASHSFGALAAVVAASYLILRLARRDWRWWTLVVGIAYASHLLLDFFTVDTRFPYGIPLFWPLSRCYYLSPFALFLDVQRSADPARFWQSLFSLHNLNAATREVLILAVPLLVALRWGPIHPRQPNSS